MTGQPGLRRFLQPPAETGPVQTDTGPARANDGPAPAEARPGPAGAAPAALGTAPRASAAPVSSWRARAASGRWAGSLLISAPITAASGPAARAGGGSECTMLVSTAIGLP